MPKVVELALKRTARKKGLKGSKLNAYVYGTLNKLYGKKKKGGNGGV